MPKRLLIVEDDLHIAGPLGHELRHRGYGVDLAHTAHDAIEALRRHPPDLILLDLGLPDADGSTVLAAAQEARAPTPVIVLTARDASSDRIDQLRAGADDYVVKPFDVAELDARIVAVLRRSTAAEPEGLSVGALRLAPNGLQVALGTVPLALTPRELQVLRRLMRNAERIVSRTQLIDALAGVSEDIAPKSIEVYVHRLRQKIAGHDVEIVTARGFGYLLRRLPPTGATDAAA